MKDIILLKKRKINKNKKLDKRAIVQSDFLFHITWIFRIIKIKKKKKKKKNKKKKKKKK